MLSVKRNNKKTTNSSCKSTFNICHLARPTSALDLFHCNLFCSQWGHCFTAKLIQVCDLFFLSFPLAQSDRIKASLAKLPSCWSNLRWQNSEPYLWEFLWCLCLRCECRRPSSGQRRRHRRSLRSSEGWNPALSKSSEWENIKQRKIIIQTRGMNSGKWSRLWTSLVCGCVTGTRSWVMNKHSRWQEKGLVFVTQTASGPTSRICRGL